MDSFKLISNNIGILKEIFTNLNNTFDIITLNFNNDNIKIIEKKQDFYMHLTIQDKLFFHYNCPINFKINLKCNEIYSIFKEIKNGNNYIKFIINGSKLLIKNYIFEKGDVITKSYSTNLVDNIDNNLEFLNPLAFNFTININTNTIFTSLKELKSTNKYYVSKYEYLNISLNDNILKFSTDNNSITLIDEFFNEINNSQNININLNFKIFYDIIKYYKLSNYIKLYISNENLILESLDTIKIKTLIYLNN